MRRLIALAALVLGILLGTAATASADIWIIHDPVGNICDAYSTGSGSGFFTVMVPKC